MCLVHERARSASIRPHHHTHTWTELFIHIATIVVGLLIAVGLEQTVEHFHHLHQAHRLEDLLTEEFRANRVIVATDMALLDRLSDTENRNKASLEQTISARNGQPFR